MQYEDEEVVKAVKTAEINRNSSWYLLQISLKTLGSKSLAIKHPNSVVFYRLEKVLDVWKNHFTKLGTPKESGSFDEKHFRNVTNCGIL